MELSSTIEKEIYTEIAKRYIESAEKHIQGGINVQEVIAFNSYHAFESIASAFNVHFGNPGYKVPRNHEKKLNDFVVNYRRNPVRRVRKEDIAKLIIILNGMRNKCLYPYQTPNGFKSPKELITLKQAEGLVRKVKGIIQNIETNL